LLSQRESSTEKERTLEIGFNATSVLSHFIGNDAILDASDFPLVMRIRTKKVLWRFGFGVTSSSNEFFDNISGIFRTNKVSNYYLKFGFEHEFYKHNQWRGYWGLDIIGIREDDIVNALGINNVVISNTTNGVGAGPVLGIKYDIHPRLYFSTEASLYGIAKFTDLKQEENGNVLTLTRTDNYTANLQSPLSLYLNYRL